MIDSIQYKENDKSNGTDYSNNGKPPFFSFDRFAVGSLLLPSKTKP